MIAERVAAVRERIARSAARAGRRPDEVKLVAVSKTFAADKVAAAFAAGQRDFGENKVQEAEQKAKALEELRAQGLRWHLIGHLQSNKAKKAAQLFDVVQSIDGAAIAQKLDQHAAEARRPLDVLVQVDLAGEATKHGVDEAGLLPLLEAMRALQAVRARGLMILPPWTEDGELSRPYFGRLRELRDRALRDGLLHGSELSMGMSHDFEVAIEEGATLVRVGTAIFGPRR